MVVQILYLNFDATNFFLEKMVKRPCQFLPISAILLPLPALPWPTYQWFRAGFHENSSGYDYCLFAGKNKIHFPEIHHVGDYIKLLDPQTTGQSTQQLVSQLVIWQKKGIWGKHSPPKKHYKKHIFLCQWWMFHIPLYKKKLLEKPCGMGFF